MLNKVVKLGGLFAQKTEHPLADARELRKVLAELPRDNAFRALDEIAGWLESMAGVAEFPRDRLYEVVLQLEDAAQPHLKRLAREYFHTSRLSRSEENRLWSINYGVSTLLADSYERCLSAVVEKPRTGELARSVLPALTIRQIAALARMLKWELFHYGPSRSELWQRAGRALLAAEAAGLANKAVALPGRSGMTTPQFEYQKLMVFQAASLDSLVPLEIEVAEQLIAYFLPSFVYTERALIDSVYWSDLTLPQAPLRLARMPAQAAPTQRFIKPGPAHEAMMVVREQLERGNEMPPEIPLGTQYPPKLLVRVLRHLTTYLSPIPPQRKHERHRVMNRMAVLNGLVNAFAAFAGKFEDRIPGLAMESWVVENVSRGGFGAVLSSQPGEWMRVGALIAMQPEGGENWLVGVIRRYRRINENEAQVGIQVLAHRVVAEELRVRTASSYASAAGVPALILTDGNEPDEFRLILPPATFDPRVSMEYARDGRRYVLAPVTMLEQTADYELARYRRSAIG